VFINSTESAKTHLSAL